MILFIYKSFSFVKSLYIYLLQESSFLKGELFSWSCIFQILAMDWGPQVDTLWTTPSLESEKDHVNLRNQSLCTMLMVFIQPDITAAPFKLHPSYTQIINSLRGACRGWIKPPLLFDLYVITLSMCCLLRPAGKSPHQLFINSDESVSIGECLFHSL